MSAGPTGRFEALRQFDAGLADEGADVEKLFASFDPKIGVGHVRTWLHRVLDILERSYNIPPSADGSDDDAKIFRRIEALKPYGVPDNILGDMHKIRMYGNLALHPSKDKPVTSAIGTDALARAHRICDWLQGALTGTRTRTWSTSFWAGSTQTQTSPGSVRYRLKRRTRRRFGGPLLTTAMLLILVFGFFALRPSESSRFSSNAPSLSPVPRTAPVRYPSISMLAVGRTTSNPDRIDLHVTESSTTIPGPFAHIAAKLYYENAVTRSTRFTLTLAHGDDRNECLIEAQYQNGSATCRWESLAAGQYSLTTEIDGKLHSTKTFTITAAAQPQPPKGTAPPKLRAPAGGISQKNESSPWPVSDKPAQPRLVLLRTLTVDIAPYIPQHVIFDDADEMVVRNMPGVAILLNGQKITDCSGREFTTAQHGMYTFESCGNTRGSIQVVKYVRR